VPAARLAFDRASRLAPDHPAPAYFLGLAWMQSGEAERALKVWRELKARSTPDAPWVPMLDRQIAIAQMMQKMGSMPAAAPGMMPSGMADAAQQEIEAP
jgi:cytochrome c-type biogenesis protein CcmH